MKNITIIKVYTLAAVPMDAEKCEVAVINLSPMTLQAAESKAKFYSEWYKSLLNKYKFSHIVAFNYEALTHEIPFDILYESR